MHVNFPSETIEWLLSNDLPTVRYQALKAINGLPEDHPDVREARRDIMCKGPVKRILDKQKSEGHWGDEEHFYQRSKYKGTSWNLIALAELDADGNDVRVRKACEAVLRTSQVRSSGGFSYKGTPEKGGWEKGTLPCLTSNMVYSMSRLGCSKDIRVIEGLEWLVRYQRFTSDPPLTTEPPYERNMCWRPHDCRPAAIKCLKAFSTFPADNRSIALNSSVSRGIDFVLSHCLGIDKGGLSKNIKDEWLNIGIPCMWNTDILEIATVLKALGVEDDLLLEVKSKILGMMDPQKRLVQKNPFAKRFLTRIEKNDEPSGLLTVKAYQLFN